MSSPAEVPRPSANRADALALRILAAPGAEAAPARMRALFAREHVKPSHQRRVRDLVYRALAWRGILDHAFALASPAPLAAQLRPRLDLLALAVLAGEASVAQAQAELPFLDWALIRRARELAHAQTDAAARVATLAALPLPLAQRLVAGLGDTATAFADSCLAAAPVHVRANLLRNDRAALQAKLAAEGVATQPCRFAPHGLHVVAPAQLLHTAAFRSGCFELQDEASQLVAALVGAAPGMRVADVCAGAGGKTLALAATLANRGSLLALDTDAPRLRDLATRARRAGATSIRPHQVPAEHWPDALAAEVAQADRVLVDAPCSGLGTLRRSPELREWLATADLAALHRRQRELLLRAARVLRPGARLVYATCSVLPEENQAAVEATLAVVPLRCVPPNEALGAELAALTDPSGRFVATRPDRDGCDGFFAAVLERT